MTNAELIKGRWVLTGDEVLADAAVAVEVRRIIETGSAAALSRRYAGAEVIGSEHSAVLPGFVNAHHHSHGVSTLQHGCPDALLPGPDRVSDDDYLEIVTARAADFDDHPLIDVWFAPPGPQWVSDELMRRIVARADAHSCALERTTCAASSLTAKSSCVTATPPASTSVRPRAPWPNTSPHSPCPG